GEAGEGVGRTLGAETPALSSGRADDREHGPGATGQGLWRAARIASVPWEHGTAGAGDVRRRGEGLRRGRGIGVAWRHRRRRPRREDFQAAGVWRDEDEDTDRRAGEEVRGQAARLGEATGELALGRGRGLGRNDGAGSRRQAEDESQSEKLTI